LVSPWIDPQIDSTQYQNTSILRFVQDFLVQTAIGLPPVHLTERDLHANGFAKLFTRDSPRTDCPQVIEGYGPTFGVCPSPSQGLELKDAVTEDAVNYANQPPEPYRVDIAKEYAEILPGHPDSGKPITREFPTNAALAKYVQERNQAALLYYAKGEQKPTM
jgi:hypothetical protein